MQETKDYNMFSYVEKGKTMYDVISKYFPELQSDFSTENLINKMPDISKRTNQNKYNEKLIIKNYFDVLKKLENSIYNIEFKNLSYENLLIKLNDIHHRNNFSSIFISVEECIDYLYKNHNNIDSKDLSELIVSETLPYIDREERYIIRSNALNFIYLPQARNELQLKYPDRVSGKYPEWDEFEFIKKTFYARLKEYDQTLTKYNICIDKYKKKNLLHNEINSKNKMELYKTKLLVSEMRNDIVKNEIYRTLSYPDIQLAKKQGIEYVIFDSDNINESRENSVSWEITLNTQPIVLFDEIADYSNIGTDAQKVIVISYGDFNYDLKIAKSISQLELVGITRIGIDGVNNYFLVMPKNNVKNGYYINNNKITEKQKQFFSRVFFSDFYLSKVIKGNFRYLGYICEEGNGTYKIIGADPGRFDLISLNYASNKPGKINGKIVNSLEEYCNSKELLDQHLNIIKKLTSLN